jgi:hypothetical protein
MAGATTDTWSCNRARARGAAALLSAIALIAISGALAPSARAQVSCPAQPVGLSPAGDSTARFTMLLRINTQANVNTYSNFVEADGGLGGRIRPQDIFVLNTRFTGSGGAPAMTATVATDLATKLRTAFPCNRIIALNGLSFDPFNAGYAFSLFDHPAVFALMADFEPMDWNAGIPTAPGRPPWNQTFTKALPQIKSFDALLAATLAGNFLASGKRSGMVPIDDETWNYGQIAQDLDKKNARLGSKLGPQSVMSQDSCADSGPTGFAARAAAIMDQYRFKYVIKVKKKRKKGKLIKKKVTVRRKLKKKARPNLSNLALQISFSDTPNPSAGMAITKTSASTAALCAFAGLGQGAGAFFFFASDQSMRLLFQGTTIGTLRPPTT